MITCEVTCSKVTNSETNCAKTNALTWQEGHTMRTRRPNRDADDVHAMYGIALCGFVIGFCVALFAVQLGTGCIWG
jgi:hypothetical protein